MSHQRSRNPSTWCELNNSRNRGVITAMPEATGRSEPADPGVQFDFGLCAGASQKLTLQVSGTGP